MTCRDLQACVDVGSIDRSKQTVSSVGLTHRDIQTVSDVGLIGCGEEGELCNGGGGDRAGAHNTAGPDLHVSMAAR